MSCSPPKPASVVESRLSCGELGATAIEEESQRRPGVIREENRVLAVGEKKGSEEVNERATEQ